MIGAATATAIDQVVAFDVSSFVRTQMAGDKVATFAVTPANNDEKTVHFQSRESGLPPALEFTGIPMGGKIHVEIARAGAGVVSSDSRITVTQLRPTIKMDVNVDVYPPDSDAGNGARGQAWKAKFNTIPAAFLHFPRLIQNDAQWTGVAIANSTPQAAQLTFYAYSNSGQLLSTLSRTNPRTAAITSHSQLANVAFQLFLDDGFKADSGWLKVGSSAAGGLTGFYLAFDPALNTMDGTDVSGRLLESLVIGETQNAELSLVNPSDTQQAVVAIQFVNNLGQVQGTTQTAIPPNGRFVERVGNLFSTAIVDAGGYLNITSTPGLAATETFGVPNTYLAALNPIDTAGGGRLLYSPQFVVGGGIWKTTLTLINLEATSTAVSLSLIGDTGTTIGRTASVNLPPRGRVVISDPGILGVTATGDVVQGYVRVSSDTTRIAGYVRFGDPGDSRFHTALPFVTDARNELIYSQVAQNSTFFTGVAIINANADPATVTVSVFNTSGTRVGGGTATIPAGGRISKLLTDIIPTLPAISSGYFRVSSSRPVFSFALFGTHTLSVLSAVPPQAP